MADTKPGSFTALPAGTDISSFIGPLINPGVTQYKASLARLRGNNLYSVIDYGAVGDASTNDRASFQACHDQMDTDAVHGTLWVPQGDYRIVESAGQGINLKRKLIIRGEHMQTWTTTRPSRINYESVTAGTPLFYLSSSNALWYSYSGFYDFEMVCTNGNTVSNQHCWGFGNGTSHGSAMTSSIYQSLQIADFSGAIWHLDHTGGGSRWGSYDLVSHLRTSNVGAVFHEEGNTGATIPGTNNVWINVFHSGWNDQSPKDYIFNFHGIREINMYNFVVEGVGPGATKKAFFFWGANSWFVLDGCHFEQTTDQPTVRFEFLASVINNTHRKVFLRNSPLWDVKVCNYLTIVAHNIGTATRGELTSDLIDETNTTIGNWSIFVEYSGYPMTIDPRHIGRVIVRDGTDVGDAYTQLTQAYSAEYIAGRDGWLCGVSSSPNATQPFGTSFVWLQLPNITYDVIGIVDDPEEGRVFGYRTPNVPTLEVRTNLPSAYLGTTTAGEVGAMVSWAFRYKIITASSSYRQLFYNFGATAGVIAGNLGGDFTPPVTDTWLNLFMSITTNSAGNQLSSSTAGAGTPDSTVEIRIAHARIGLGAAATYNGGGGGRLHASVAANHGKALEWFDDADWSSTSTSGIYGDYKLGDKVWRRSPAAGATPGYVCTSAGSLADAHPGSTVAVDLGDWCLADTNRIYVCITAGTTGSGTPPTGTGSDITDGTVHWAYRAQQAVFKAMASLAA